MRRATDEVFNDIDQLTDVEPEARHWHTPEPVEKDVATPSTSTPEVASANGQKGRGKLLRIVVGLMIVGLAVWTYYPGLFLPIGTRAVINARVLTVRAPIAGVVTELTAKEGFTVQAGQSLGTIVDRRADPTRLEQLRTEAAALRERTAVLEKKIVVLKAMKSRLDDELSKYRQVVMEHYERRIDENRAIRRARAALAAHSDANFHREKSLQAKKLTSEEKVDRAKSEAEVSRARLAEIDHILERLSSELAAARQGIFLADGFNNVPYSQQRMDEITITLTSTQSDLDEGLIRYRELEREIEIEEKRHELLRSASLVATHTGPVWRNLVNVGEYVKQGAPLLEVIDPSEVFLLVHLDVRHFDTLSKGDRATIELLGSDAEIEGRVINLRAGQAIRDQDALAVRLAAPDQREFRVMVGVDARDLGSNASDFLQVGRVARVRIQPDKSGFPFDRLFSGAIAKQANSRDTHDDRL